MAAPNGSRLVLMTDAEEIGETHKSFYAGLFQTCPGKRICLLIPEGKQVREIHRWRKDDLPGLMKGGDEVALRQAVRSFSEAMTLAGLKQKKDLPVTTIIYLALNPDQAFIEQHLRETTGTISACLASELTIIVVHSISVPRSWPDDLGGERTVSVHQIKRGPNTTTNEVIKQISAISS